MLVWPVIMLLLKVTTWNVSLYFSPEGNVKMVEAKDGEIVYNDKLSFFSVDLKLCFKNWQWYS